MYKIANLFFPVRNIRRINEYDVEFFPSFFCYFSLARNLARPFPALFRNSRYLIIYKRKFVGSVKNIT